MKKLAFVSRASSVTQFFFWMFIFLFWHKIFKVDFIFKFQNNSGMTTELGPPGAKISTVSRAGFGGRGPSKLVAGGIWSQSKFFFLTNNWNYWSKNYFCKLNVESVFKNCTVCRLRPLTSVFAVWKSIFKLLDKIILGWNLENLF